MQMNKTSMVRVLIIDDHPLVSEGIAAMLTSAGYITIAGTCKTAADAIAFMQSESTDVILMDIGLPDMDGLQLCPLIRSKDKQLKIVGLSSSAETSIIGQMLQRGANGYLLKNAERSELIEAIDKVMDGHIYLSRAANESFLLQFKTINDAIDNVPALTRREKEILQLLNEGLNGPQIAARLFLSQYTVETHRKNLLQKFNVNNTVTLLKSAREQRVI